MLSTFPASLCEVRAAVIFKSTTPTTVSYLLTDFAIFQLTSAVIYECTLHNVSISRAPLTRSFHVPRMTKLLADPGNGAERLMERNNNEIRYYRFV